MNADELMNHAVKFAMTILSDKGNIQPLIYIHFLDDDDVVNVLALPFKSDDAKTENAMKAAGILTVRKIVEAKRFKGLTLTSEAWLSSNPERGRPSQDPERKDILIIHVRGENFSVKTLAYEMDGKTVKTGDPIKMDASVTWIDSAFDRDN